MYDAIAVSLMLIISLAMPMTIFLLRENIKLIRQSIISDLADFFRVKHKDYESEDSDISIIPSFEFVKYKYFMNKKDNFDNDLPQSKYLYSMVPLIIVLLIGSGAILFGFSANEGNLFAAGALKKAVGDIDQLKIVFIVSFLAAYLSIVKKMVRAVSRFDLNPLTYLTSADHVFSAVFTSTVFYLGSVALAGVWRGQEVLGLGTVPFAFFIIAAFIFGIIPDFGLLQLKQYASLHLIKRQDAAILRQAKIVPIEAMDGIDASIKDRLEEFGIYDVQNLATTNPIMLFVETPFGIYQTIDWVAQAQLCTAVGPEKFVALRELHIRTIFDFEAAMLGTTRVLNPAKAPPVDDPVRNSANAKLRSLVARIIVPGVVQAGAGIDGSPDYAIDDDGAIKLARMIVDDLHIHRLRQIYLIIQNRLNPRFGVPT